MTAVKTKPVQEQTDKPERIKHNTPPALNKREFQALQKRYSTKSSMIRALAARNLSIAMISHTLLHYGVLSPRSSYQHVRNVLKTPLKRKQTKE